MKSAMQTQTQTQTPPKGTAVPSSQFPDGARTLYAAHSAPEQYHGRLLSPHAHSLSRSQSLQTQQVTAQSAQQAHLQAQLKYQQSYQQMLATPSASASPDFPITPTSLAALSQHAHSWHLNPQEIYGASTLGSMHASPDIAQQYASPEFTAAFASPDYHAHNTHSHGLPSPNGDSHSHANASPNPNLLDLNSVNVNGTLMHFGA